MNSIENFIFKDQRISETYNKENFTHKTILITGACGTIGREILEQISAFNPYRIILFDHNETSLIQLYNQYRNNKSINYIPIPGTILDESLLESTLNEYMPDIIIHAAAYKIVPLCELNPIIAIHNNILASINLFKLAGLMKIPKVMFISSNEAFKPQNVFGYSKKIAELSMNYYSQIFPNTEYKAIRFGFVLFSQGSVAELFQNQINQNKNLTICDPAQKKYICSKQEAVGSILSSFDIGISGQVLTFDMGEPVKVFDIAKKFIQYYDSQSKIEVIGLRPGDKLIEPITDGEHGLTPTANSRLFITNIENIEHKIFEDEIEELFNFKYSTDNKIVFDKLIKICKDNTV